VLIRETVQNSWDAGKDSPGSVDYRIRLRELSKNEQDVLRNVVFQNLPEYDRDPEHSIRKTLEREPVTAIEICDFGTTGLGGPTNPADVPKEGDSPDFVDFVRNIGSPRDTVYGGGTYGYGKSCLYAFSKCRAIIIDSVTKIDGASTRRLMGCRVASRYDIKAGAERGRYTGRHWWGRHYSKSILEPLAGSDAQDLSEALGMCRRGADDFGTSILILAPELDFASLDEAAQRAINILLWFCWPKLVTPAHSDHSPMTFSVEVNGNSLTVPHPDECPPLDLFADSLRKVRSTSDEAVAIRSQRPAKDLGYLHIQRGAKGGRLPGFADEDISLIPHTASHVALMRPAELVVKYAIGEPLPSDDVEWGGVFVCSAESEVEQAFAAAEPPAHDDWDPQSLAKGRKKTFVRVALARIREKVNEVAAHLSTSPTRDDARSSLGPVADLLGAMLTSAEGQRLGSVKKKLRRVPARRRQGTTVSRPVFLGYELRDGDECARFEVCIASGEERVLSMTGDVRILKDGGGADVDDAHGRAGRVLAWISEDSSEVPGPIVRVSIAGEQRWIAVVAIPKGKAISLVPSVEECT
jgi:hypothetical protein